MPLEEYHNITGAAELFKRLDELPDKLETKILRGAVRAAAKVVKAGAESLVPYTRSAMADTYGHIRDTLKITTSARGGVITASVRTGKDQFWAVMVERGTKAHTITAKTSKGMRVGGGGVSIVFRKSVPHPGAAPHPFMGPALDATADAALVAFSDYVREHLPEAVT